MGPNADWVSLPFNQLKQYDIVNQSKPNGNLSAITFNHVTIPAINNLKQP